MAVFKWKIGEWTFEEQFDERKASEQNNEKKRDDNKEDLSPNGKTWKAI